jgi:hypothetical protein
MSSNLSSIFVSISSFFRRSPALLGGVVLCLSPNLLPAQSVTFNGAQTYPVPPGGFGNPLDVAVDAAGNLFIADDAFGPVLELQRTGTGYGPPTALPVTGLSPVGVAVDTSGDVFIVSDSNPALVVELPRTGAVYGPQTTLPFSGLNGPIGVAVDNAGDVIVSDSGNGRVVELPWTGTGYGPQITLPTPGLGFPIYIAVDKARDVFIVDIGKLGEGRVVELPWTGTEYGALTTLPASVGGASGVAVDSTGDVFIAVYAGGRVVELPWTGNGYGPQKTICNNVDDEDIGLAVDNTGDVFFGAVSALVEIQTQSVTFGSAAVCGAGAMQPQCSQTLTLNFNVNADVTLGTPKVLNGGAPDLDFTLASGSTCSGAMTAGSSCAVNVTFDPQVLGKRNGTVEITDSGGAVITSTRISGLGVAKPTGNPAAQVSTDYLQFDDIFFGSTETKPVTVTNAGGGTLTVEPSISTYSGGPSHSYTIAGNTCGGGVTAGSSCTLQVEFSPTLIGTHYGLLTLQTNGSANSTVGLHGVAVGLSVLGGGNGAPLKFGSVTEGSMKVLPLTVTNVGLPGTVTVDSAITVRATAHPTTTYKILATSQNTCLAGIAAGQSCTLPVEFAPTSSGTHDDLLTLTPNAGGGSTTVWLSGSTP